MTLDEAFPTPANLGPPLRDVGRPTCYGEGTESGVTGKEVLSRTCQDVRTRVKGVSVHGVSVGELCPREAL